MSQVFSKWGLIGIVGIELEFRPCKLEDFFIEWFKGQGEGIKTVVDCSILLSSCSVWEMNGVLMSQHLPYYEALERERKNSRQGVFSSIRIKSIFYIKEKVLLDH